MILSNHLVKLQEVKVGERRDYNKTTIKVVNEVSFQDFFSKCVYRFLMCNCKYGNLQDTRDLPYSDKLWRGKNLAQLGQNGKNHQIKSVPNLII